MLRRPGLKCILVGMPSRPSSRPHGVFALRHFNSIAIVGALACACANAGITTHATSSSATDPAQSQPGDAASDGDNNNNGGTAAANAPAPDGLRYIGRFGPQLVMSWTNTAAELTFTGTSASFGFTLNGTGGAVVGVSVDGGPLAKTPIVGTTQVQSGVLSNGPHTVRATKISEGRLGEITLNDTNVVGTATAAATPTRRIEVIGDSISAAYGVDGTSASCVNNYTVEDASLSFASLAGTALQADVSLIAWAGKGVWRNDASDTNAIANQVTMRTLWTRAVQSNSAAYPFDASVAPQAVVVELGTNDYEYTADNSNGTPQAIRATLDHNAFVSAYVALLTDVQTHYPNAIFVLCSSPMLSDSYPTASDMQSTDLVQDLQAIATQFGQTGADVSVLTFPALSANDLVGCGGHPTADGHAQMAAALQAELAGKLNW